MGAIDGSVFVCGCSDNVVFLAYVNDMSRGTLVDLSLRPPASSPSWSTHQSTVAIRDLFVGFIVQVDDGRMDGRHRHDDATRQTRRDSPITSRMNSNDVLSDSD
jgi:hypothetical protein